MQISYRIRGPNSYGFTSITIVLNHRLLSTLQTISTEEVKCTQTTEYQKNLFLRTVVILGLKSRQKSFHLCQDNGPAAHAQEHCSTHQFAVCWQELRQIGVQAGETGIF